MTIEGGRKTSGRVGDENIDLGGQCLQQPPAGAALFIERDGALGRIKKEE
jgi:hypothetical protein